jgi:serine/threonine-protein kinase
MTALNERYELGHRIGGGGMAEVVEAYDHKLDRRVAVKLLRLGSSDPRARERFMREAQMAAGFAHPNVVTVYDVGEEDDQPYLVMELIDGRTLAEVLREHGPLPVDRAMAATDALLAGLAAAHDHGLVHRDVKPANVLIGRDGRIKLTDFGIATAVGSTTAGLTATGQVMGTPAYLSPEQVDGHEATSRTDLYAVGVVLYEMLAGNPPFHGEHAVSVALAHRNEVPPPLDAARDDLPPGLARVVARALEKDPADRFADAPAMREALRAVADGGGRRGGADTTIAATMPEPTQTLPPVALAGATAASPPGPATRTGTRAPRRTRRIPPAAVIALIVVLGIAAGLFLASGDGSPQRAVQQHGLFPSVSVDPPTQPPVTTTTLPTTIDGLIAMLTANPDAFGTRSGDLLEGLIKLRDKPDPKGKQAEHLARDIEKWVSNGELDASMGQLTLNILGMSTDFSGDQQGGGSGED